MRAFRRLCIAVITVFLILAAVLNIVMLQNRKYADGQYRVEAKRLADEIAETGSYDSRKYPHITGVYTRAVTSIQSDEHYVIIEAGGTLYRVEYITRNADIPIDYRKLHFGDHVFAVMLCVSISGGTSSSPSAG